MRTRDVWQMHRRSLVAERRSKSTLAFYESAVKKWEKWLDVAGVSDDLERLTRLDLQAYQLWLRESEGLSPGGEHALLRGLRAVAKWGEAEELISSGPFHRFRMPSLPRERLAGVQPQQVADMLRAARAGVEQPLRDVAVVMTLYDTGLRVSELCALRVEDVDLEQGLVAVRAETAKRQKGRVVPIGARTAKAVLTYQRRERQPGLATVQELFISRRTGLPMTREGVGLVLARLGAVADVPRSECSPHAFRRGFAVEFLRRGGDVFALQQLLGHSSLSQTRQYVTYLPSDLQRVHGLAGPGDRL